MKVLKNILYIVILLLLTKEITAQQLSQEYNINSQELAYEKAMHFTGFNFKTHSLKSLSENKQIVLKTLDNENLPIQDKNFIGKEVWEVTFPNVDFDFPNLSQRIKNMQIEKTFKVTIDAKTGSLIKIIAQQDTTKTLFFDKKTKSAQEEELSRRGEKYLDITADTPKTSMKDALSTAVFAYPTMAEELYIVCVFYQSEFEDEVFLAWCISSYNIKNEIDSYLGSNVKTVINATTGKPIYSASLR